MINNIWPIIGHQNIIQYLQISINNQKITHAYLFSGQPNLGKKTLAFHFISSLLSIPEEKSFIHPDLYILERENNLKTGKKQKNITIEQVRGLIHKLSLGSFLNSYKIGIIKEAESLSKEAANCLLKTLEEPTLHTVIILITSELKLLLPTIISRCQILNFRSVKREVIFDYLLKKGANRNLADNLSFIAHGRPGKAIRFMEDQEKWKEYGNNLVFFENFQKSSLSHKFKAIQSLLKKEDDSQKKIFLLTSHLNIWLSLLRDMLLLKKRADNLIMHHFIKENLFKWIKDYSVFETIMLIEKIEQTKKYLKENINPQLALENLSLYF